MKALVVEDDTVTQLVLGRLLTAQGYEVTAFASAEKAIAAYRCPFYPLVFLDLFLTGKDGFALCRWIRLQPEGERHPILSEPQATEKGTSKGSSMRAEMTIQEVLTSG